MNLLLESQSTGRSVEQLIFKHDVPEVGLLLQQAQELIEGNNPARGLLDVELLLYLGPQLITLHYRASQLLKKSLKKYFTIVRKVALIYLHQ
jgi:hypothetical protein